MKAPFAPGCSSVTCSQNKQLKINKKTLQNRGKRLDCPLSFHPTRQHLPRVSLISSHPHLSHLFLQGGAAARVKVVGLRSRRARRRRSRPRSGPGVGARRGGGPAPTRVEATDRPRPQPERRRGSASCAGAARFRRSRGASPLAQVRRTPGQRQTGFPSRATGSASARSSGRKGRRPAPPRHMHWRRLRPRACATSARWLPQPCGRIRFHPPRPGLHPHCLRRPPS